MLESLAVDLQPFYTYSFNELLEVNGAEVQGSFVGFSRDEKTQKIHEILENGMGRSWSYNKRGFIDKMDLDFGVKQVSKDFNYNFNGHLSNLNQSDSVNANQDYSYTYDLDGVISEVINNNTAVTHLHTNSSWEVGDIEFDLDSFGRVTQRKLANNIKEKVLSYGATGRVGEVKEKNKSLAQYFYDHENNPIVKEYASGQIEFYFEDSVVKGNKLYQPLKLGAANHALGYFTNTEFIKVDVDHLGTILRDSKDKIKLPSPYGERASRGPQDYNLFDFTLKGYDEDLEAVRMGRRYYDPKAKLFLTPDTYFLENYDKIAESPVEGNLYSYGINNPISNVDPKGQMGQQYLQAVFSASNARQEPQRAMNSVKQAAKTTATIAGGAALAAGAVASSPIVVPFVAQKVTALALAGTISTNNALIGVGMYTAKNPQRVENALGAITSFAQGFSQGITKTTSSVDIGPSFGKSGTNAVTSFAGEELGKFVRKNYVEK